MKITVIITGYNCEQYAKRCIDSVINQTHKPHQILVWNDNSTDNTAKVLKEYGNQLLVEMGVKKRGALFGRWWLVNKRATGDVCVFLGLDDELPLNALEIVAKAYQDKNVWMSYGAWRRPNGVVAPAPKYPDELFANKSFRRHAWLATALNTFKTELLKAVPVDKLLNEQMAFFDNCTDLAYSYPCLEMCQPHNVAVINECTYIYHDNPQSTLNRLGKAHKTKIREYLKTIKPCTTHLNIGATE
jgi:glycosyltransferase involved in cell wall biosynthesis